MADVGTPIVIYKKGGKKGGECKYCKGWYRHFADLEDHVETEHDAEICDDHRLIFDCYEDKMAHNVVFHNACPNCGRKFYSEGGRKLHIQNEHKVDSNMKCHGCGGTFKSAGPFVSHLMNGECQGIGREEFEDHVHHKAIINDALDRGTGFASTHTKSRTAPSEFSEKFEADVSMRVVPRGGRKASNQTNGSSHNSSDNAALLDMDDDEQRNLTGNMRPTEYAGSECGDTTEKFNEATISSAATENGDTDSTNENHSAFNEVQEEDGEDDFPPLPSATTVPSRGSPVDDKTATKATGPDSPHSDNGSNNLDNVWDQVHARNKKLEAEYTASRSGPIKAPTGTSMNWFKNRFWNPRSESWDPSNFFNHSTNRYECPHPGCDWSDPTETAITEHAKESHRATSLMCPVCYKYFDDLAGLVSHCENSSRRCRIKDTARWPQFLDEITGGFLSAGKRDEHGRVIYEVSKPTEFEDRLTKDEREVRGAGRDARFAGAAAENANGGRAGNGRGAFW
ncbi:MAG: hypothetical protein M1831_004357 [Alyxoria varia]|nr:MAG: hypothetical protein M1831_004357 [Alyxoria varia]